MVPKCGVAQERAFTQAHRTDAPERAREALSYAKASIVEREAVSHERGITRDALRRGMGETLYIQVRTEFDGRENRGEFVAVPRQKYDTGQRFTTPETIAAERANVEHMRAGKNAVDPHGDPRKSGRSDRDMAVRSHLEGNRPASRGRHSADTLQGFLVRGGLERTAGDRAAPWLLNGSRTDTGCDG